MNRRIVRRIATLASLVGWLGASGPARAAEHERPPQAAKAAAPDTNRLLPRWLHVHGSAGLGWLASPDWMRKFYQAGQSYDLGLDVRPGATFKLRLAGEYQALPAVTDAAYSYVTSVSGLESAPARDTILVETRANGWLGSGRLEAQWSLAPQLWVIGGLGRGYMDTGLHSVHASDPSQSFDLDFPGSSGWSWIATAGTSYEFEMFGPKLAAEVRTNYLMRGQARFQTWSIRLGWGGY